MAMIDINPGLPDGVGTDGSFRSQSPLAASGEGMGIFYTAREPMDGEVAEGIVYQVTVKSRQGVTTLYASERVWAQGVRRSSAQTSPEHSAGEGSIG